MLTRLKTVYELTLEDDLRTALKQDRPETAERIRAELDRIDQPVKTDFYGIPLPSNR